MTRLTTFAAATLVLLITAGGSAGWTSASADTGDEKPISAEAQALAEKLVFAPDGFDQDQPTQEGTTGRDRMAQDETQKLCTQVAYSRKPIDAETAAKVTAIARASIKYPAGGIKLGSWANGRRLAWSGFGFRTAHKPDNHSKREPGATCYNCHQIAADRRGGNLGPGLTGFGKMRGSSSDMLKYVYDVIYNPNALFPCSNMPRFGANGILTEKQIADVMAYIFDPESPVNE